MFKHLALFLVLGCGCSSFGQNVREAELCPTAHTQTELNRCASEAAKHADTDLNVAYSKLISQVSRDQVATSRVRTFERAWVAYRDAYIKTMYPAVDKQAAYGSIFSMEVDLLRLKLTKEQTNALKEMLEQYRDMN